MKIGTLLLNVEVISIISCFPLSLFISTALTVVIHIIYHHDGARGSNTIAVFINRLRKKLGDSLTDTERGRGYMIKAPE